MRTPIIWEYEVDSCEPLELVRRLEMLGNDGWEVFHIQTGMNDHLLIISKRPKEQGKSDGDLLLEEEPHP